MEKDSIIPIRAKVYSVDEKGIGLRCLVNVALGNFMYINSVGVMPDKKHTNELYISMPSWSRNGKRKPYIEFPDTAGNNLLKAISEAAISAYKKYENNKSLHEYGDVFYVKVDRLYDITPKFCEDVPDDIPEDFDEDNLEFPPEFQ